MKELSEQVCSLELAKKLVKVGILKASAFKWGRGGDRCEDEWKIFLLDDDSWSAKEIYNAYTVAELGEMLPIKSSTHRNFKDAYVCEVENIEEYQVAKTEANARAKMLIYLKENKLI